MHFTAESTRMITVYWNKATGNFLRRLVSFLCLDVLSIS